MPAPQPNYVHNATFVRVIDGDTYVLVLDNGQRAGVRSLDEVHIRLNGIDTWELKDPQGRGARAQAAAHVALDLASNIIVATHKPTGNPFTPSFERTVADVWVNGQSLADLLRAGGHEKS